MKAVLYARVSSKEQEKEGFSIQAQQKLLRDYASNQGIKVAKEFTDVETAKTAGRTQFGKMVEYLKTNPDIKIILVEKTDRLYRNFRDYILLEDLGIEIHLVKENEIISKDSRSHAKFIHGIKVLMAKNFIDNLSEEVKKGLGEKANSGVWPHQAPLGYLNNKTTRGIDLDTEKAPRILRLFELYATGEYSLSRVRDTVDSEGLKSRTGKRLSKSRVEATLKNPFYYGEFIWSGDQYSGTHEPIISRELFDSVQEALRREGKPKSRRRSFAFAGLLRCGRCGCQLTAEIKKGKYVYYHCTQHKGKCDQPYIREEILDEKLGRLLLEIQIDRYVADWIIETLKNSYADEKEYFEKEQKRLKRKCDDLQTRLDRAYEDRLDGIIDESYWKNISTKWRAEQDALVGRLDKLRNADRNYVDQGERIIELAHDAYSQYVRQEVMEKRRLLSYVLSNCTLDGLTLYPTYKKPFDLIVEGNKTLKEYPRQDSNLLPSA